MYSGVLLAFQNQTIFSPLVASLETLPWQLALEEVDEHVCNGLQIVSSALCYPQVI